MVQKTSKIGKLIKIGRSTNFHVQLNLASNLPCLSTLIFKIFNFKDLTKKAKSKLYHGSEPQIAQNMFVKHNQINSTRNGVHKIEF